MAKLWRSWLHWKVSRRHVHDRAVGHDRYRCGPVVIHRGRRRAGGWRTPVCRTPRTALVWRLASVADVITVSSDVSGCGGSTGRQSSGTPAIGHGAMRLYVDRMTPAPVEGKLVERPQVPVMTCDRRASSRRSNTESRPGCWLRSPRRSVPWATDLGDSEGCCEDAGLAAAVASTGGSG